MFVDSAIVKVKAGDGGSGIVSFRRERYVSRGGPDGGDGGNGGNVIFEASNNQNTLANFRYQKELKAENGSKGAKANRHGKKGEDLLVKVPVGTQISENNKIIADLTVDKQQEIIATGGRGGFGNAHFTSSVRQAPRMAEKGDLGEELELELELKIIADVGLVGLPNAGKSTLLSKISSAKPKIANYPFTTLNPHLGVVRVANNKELLIADIPGLIDGASQGRGLGDEFLRHVERTKVLLHMIDAYSEDVATNYKVIQKELKDYKIDLSKKQQIVVLTKIDGLDNEIIADQLIKLKKVAKKKEIYTISALNGSGLKELMYVLYEMVERHRVESEKIVLKEIPVIGVKENIDNWKIEYKKNKVIVHGGKIERFASRTDFENEDGVRRLRDIMHKMGILREIENKEIEMNTKIYFGDNREDYMEY